MTKRSEHLREKKCEYPTCQTIFFGVGRTKYCHEHRKRKYRNTLNRAIREQKKFDEESQQNNQTIPHKYLRSQDILMECSLDGCPEKFFVKLTKNTNVYPKYCEKHRNPYKRKLFQQRRQNQ